MKFKKILKDSIPYMIVAMVIFMIIISVGVVVVNTLYYTINNNGIRTEVVIVKDKHFGDGEFADYYLIETTDNKTYSIINHDDNYGKRMFDSIEIGKRYELTLQDPSGLDMARHTHIVKVENDTVSHK